LKRNSPISWGKETPQEIGEFLFKNHLFLKKNSQKKNFPKETPQEI
jgi:hypothetical protein